MAGTLIQICGDPTVDWLSVRNEELVVGGGTYYWPPQTPKPDVRLSSQAGGYALLLELVGSMLAHDRDCEVAGRSLPRSIHREPKDQNIVTAWTAWRRYVEEGRPDAYRLEQWRECEPGDWDYERNTLDDTRTPDILVIEDSGLGFRNCEKGWPQALRDPELAGGIKRVILKLAQYGVRGDRPAAAAPPSDNHQGSPLLRRLIDLDLARHTTVLTAIQDLRACSVKVGASLSWEMMLQEVSQAVRSDATPFWRPEDQALVFEHVVVSVGASGAVVVRQDEDDFPADTLIFDRNGQENDFADRYEGDMMGYNTCLAGALVAGCATRSDACGCAVSGAGNAPSQDSQQEHPWVVWAARDGVALARMLQMYGYEVQQARGHRYSHLCFPHGLLRNAYWDRQTTERAPVVGLDGVPTFTPQEKTDRAGRLEEDLKDAWALGVFCATGVLASAADRWAEGRWTILEDVVGRAGADTHAVAESRAADAVCTLAREIVRIGTAKALRNVPVESIGGWESADRHEIEGVRSVLNAFKAHLSGKKTAKPLSIAVFGPPGAGKSFVVKQIAERLKLRKEDQLTFNLSQFESPEELAPAFHQARDLCLQGRLPVVFWDEFDTPCGERQLGWLRYFLAPMQDGEFVDGGRTFATGGGIYVFAGATCHSFHEFCSGDGPDCRAAKKPDFISRLQAYMDVRGINGIPDSITDQLYPIRRAVLLHSLLKRHAKHLRDDTEGFRLDPGVMDAFLKTTRYRHGARSMEAVITMSTLGGRKKYELSSLPPENILRMHVDSNEFTAFTQIGGKDALRVGITGHINLDEARMKLLTAGIGRAVRFIQKRYPDCALTVFSPLAVGADRLVARELMHDPAARLIAVLPVDEDDYMTDFGTTDSHAEDYGAAEKRQEFRHWLSERAVDIVRIRPTATRDRAYYETGHFIAEHCDIMTAIWDGQPAQGEGGTGDVIAIVKDRCKPLVHVWAGNHKAKEAHRTDVGPLHGKFRYMNFPGGTEGEWIDELRIGVTGHRVLAEPEKLRQAVAEVFDRIERVFGERPRTIVSPLADGADMMVAEEGIGRPDTELIVPLPMPEEAYVEDFADPDTHARFVELKSTAAGAFAMPATLNREDAYQQVGQLVVDTSDVLIAIWDGKPARGRGGTTEMVARARKRGIPIFHIKAGNRDPETGEPTSLGDEQGMIVEYNMPE